MGYETQQRGQVPIEFRRNDHDRRPGRPVSLPGDRPPGRVRADEMTQEAIAAHNRLLRRSVPAEKGPWREPEEDQPCP